MSQHAFRCVFAGEFHHRTMVFQAGMNLETTWFSGHSGFTAFPQEEYRRTARFAAALYWHAMNASASTETVLPPAASINAAVVCSDGEQSATLPDDGTIASPSIL